MCQRQSRLLGSIAVPLLLIAALRPVLADSVDEYIRAEMAEQRVPGVALAVIRNGSPVKVTTYGAANIELDTPVTTRTVFRLASISKQIIATGVMLLVTDGKLSLADPVCKYLRHCPTAWKAISIEQVLSHTSGLPNEAPGNNPFKLESNDAVLGRAFDVPLQFKPGQGWAYSNLGYGVLVEIIQNVTGRPWPEFFTTRIFQPLGMSATRTKSAFDVIPNRAGGYQYRDDKLHNVPQLIAMRPGGAFVSTLEDMIKWDLAITRGRLLSRAAQERMWTAVRLPNGTSTRYGFGWWTDEVRGHRRIRHGGSEPGVRTEYSRFPDDGIAVIVLANGTSILPDEIALQVAGTFIRGLSVQRKWVRLSERELAAYAGRYELSPSNILTIGVDGAGLSIESSDPSQGDGEFHMRASSPDTFFISNDENETFKRSGSVVTELDILSGQSILKARKVP